MGNLVLNGSTSGSITVAPTAVAGSNTLTLPAVTDTVTCNAATQTLTNKTLTSPTINTPTMGGSVLTAGGVPTISGSPTSVVINASIPSWVRWFMVPFDQIMSSASSNYQLQLGPSSGYVTSGYVGESVGSTFTTGFKLNSGNSSTSKISGIANIVLTNPATNLWTCTVFSGDMTAASQSAIITFVGSIALSGPLTQIRLTTVNGTDTFASGTINMIYG